MRSLRIVVQTAGGTLPLVVAASVTALGACGKSARTDDDTGANNAGMGSSAAQGGVSSGGASATGGVFITGGAPTGGTPSTGGTITIDGGSGTGGTPFCNPSCQEIVVTIPTQGMPIEPGQVCAATVEPVESNRTAFITFEPTMTSFQSVAGFVAIAPEVMVMGTPTLEVLDSNYQELLELQIEPLVTAPGGFSFQGSFPTPFMFDPSDGYARMTMRASLEVACDGGTRLVHAVTDLHLCMVDGVTSWASSGQSCCVCRIIAEMAPSPIVPDKHADELPLAQAIRLRIVELARVSNTIILLAENDGGEGLEYEWLPSAGRVERLADDVIAWTLEEGTHDPFVQAAVYGPDAAAVASFAFNDRAA